MKTFIKLMLIAAIMISLVSCGARKPIRIGFMGTVSGASNDLSLNGLHGASMAVQEINAAGGINGRNIELVVKDTLNDKTITKRVVNDFIREGIDIVIGEFTSSLMETALEEDVNQKILFLSPTASSGIFSDLDDNMIRFIGETEQQGLLIAGQAGKNNDKKFIIIKDGVNKAYVDATSSEFIKELNNQGGEVLHEMVADYTTILRSTEIMKELKESYPEADAVLFLLDSVNTTLFLQSMDEIRWNLGVYTSFWVNTGDFFKLGSQYIDGVYTVGFVEEGKRSLSTRKFEEIYSSHFGTQPSFPAYFTYDAIMALKDALEQISIINKKNIKQFIIEKGTFNGITGDFNINEFGDCSREYKSLIIENGLLKAFDLD